MPMRLVLLLATVAVVLAGACQPMPAAGEFDAFYAEADKRIEQVRKRDLELRVVDAAGQPVAGATVELRQTRSAFGFGSAIRPWDWPFLDEQYQATFKRLFEWGIDEGALNWLATEEVQGQDNYYVADRVVEWAQANGIKLHGPPLFWANDLAPWQAELRGEDLKAAMLRRIESAVPRYRGKLEFWDVENELLHFDFFPEQLGPEIRAWMFKEVRKRDPKVKLMVNEYDIIEGYEPDNVERYKEIIRGLLAQGAEIDTIGVQGHFVEDKYVDPVEVYRRLDSLAELGIPIWITEFDFGTDDEALRADGLEALYRAAFSHPMVEGVIMWGFYENAHWRPQYLPQYGPAHIVDADWGLNAAGERYVALRAAWTTAARLASDAEGRAAARGFLGSYEVTVTPQGGAPQRFAVELAKGEGPQQATLTLTDG
jgi:GH35 family endo-1,4-beta-xylanase